MNTGLGTMGAASPIPLLNKATDIHVLLTPVRVAGEIPVAVINPQSDLDTAARFARALAHQKTTSDEAKAYAEARRRDFVQDTGSSFLESIIADSDLLPIRHFGIGQLATAPVGRIFLTAPDGSGTGFATGFLVAPGILLTNWHVLQTPVWARSATLTMDAEG